MNYSLNEQELAVLKRLCHQVTKGSRGLKKGNHQNRILGNGTEFLEFSEYVPGNDLRRVDWKTEAKVGKKYVREFENEINLEASLYLDLSKSIIYRFDPSTKLSKLEISLYFAVVLKKLYELANQTLHLNFFGYPQNILRKAYPTFELSTLISHFEVLKPKTHEELNINDLKTQVTDTQKDLEKLLDLLKPGTLLYLVSDFYYDEAWLKKKLEHLETKKIKVNLIHVEEVSEKKGDFLLMGSGYLMDLETGIQEFTSQQELKRAYQEAFVSHQIRIENLAKLSHFNYYRYTNQGSLFEQIVERILTP